MPLRLCLFLLFVLSPLARATSVVPPSFPELVQEADAIYRGRVTSVQARRVAAPDGQSSVIKTFVTLVVERTLKGEPVPEVTLEFLGGKVGEDRLVVSGMPTFRVGAREIVFVQNNGRQYAPLVGLMHGRYRVLRDAATEIDHIARDNGAPLTDPADVELPLSATILPAPATPGISATARALSLEAFETSITREARRTVPIARPH